MQSVCRVAVSEQLKVLVESTQQAILWQTVRGCKQKYANFRKWCMITVIKHSFKLLEQWVARREHE
jgi:hypothetical protein